MGVAAPAILLLALASLVVYLRVKSERTADLDRSLETRAAALAALVERDGGEWETDFEDGAPPDLVDPLLGWTVAVDPDGPVLGGDGDPGAGRVWSGVFDVRTEADEPGAAPARVRVTLSQDDGAVAAELRALLGTLVAIGTASSGLAVMLGMLLSRRLVDHATYERVYRAWERQARFTADASHELRTPLAVIRTAAEVALRKERAPGEYREALGHVVAGAQRMQDTLEGLLLLARADAGALATASEVVDLQEIAAAAVAGPKPEGLAMRLEGGPVSVRGDPRQLEILVRNLVSNAMRHTPPPGEVVVRVEVQGGRAVLSVGDTGEGIPPDALPHVFERFYRVDEARGRGGAGLGLSIVETIARHHGGSVRAESTLGAGTTVFVTLPTA